VAASGHPVDVISLVVQIFSLLFDWITWTRIVQKTQNMLPLLLVGKNAL